MFKAIIDLFRVKPIDESLLAKKVDSMPQPERAAPAPSPQAEQIAKAVANKVTAPKKEKTQPKKPAVKKTRAAKKQ
jgi:hypothetical protein